MDMNPTTIQECGERLRAAHRLRFQEGSSEEITEMATWVYDQCVAQLTAVLGDPTVNETFGAIATRGYVFDGNIPSKRDRDLLRDAGLIERGHGYQWLTWIGVLVAQELDLLED